MPDIEQELPIRASARDVFAALSTPGGLDKWWTLKSSGVPKLGNSYALDFGPGYQWRAAVTRCDDDRCFELTLTEADADWTGTRVGFELRPAESGTQVRFYHRGWPEANEHYRISCHCWALYLRHLRRHVESGDFVEYGKRLDA